jgi:hypothetical protein
MALTLSLVFLALAAIFFLISALSIPTGRVSLLALGLFFLAAAEATR